MKNISRIIILLMVLALAACEKKVETEIIQSEDNKNSDRAAVTFVELGSVDCVPCKMMQPIMEQVETDFGDDVDVVFHDVWTEAGQPYAREYGIQAIPTQVFLDKDGEEFYRHTGFFPQDELYKIIENELKTE